MHVVGGRTIPMCSAKYAARNTICVYRVHNAARGMQRTLSTGWACWLSTSTRRPRRTATRTAREVLSNANLPARSTHGITLMPPVVVCWAQTRSTRGVQLAA